MKNLYFDYCSSTPLFPSVQEVILDTYQRVYANSFSTHDPGKEANKLVNEYRERIALMLGVNLAHMDMYTLSGHKIGGPKGIGILMVKDHVDIASILYGGKQESGLRPGTGKNHVKKQKILYSPSIIN